eukprot:CAMPEP_0114548916 /NCGR_PEP_ID=MMETSP0114-20121206/5244_1 /TAXON_ID=31324 /ORGANISM="Goniomonas sp, Strain m" /LENGTH=201 /DNA_ID=CAMNT_0001733553 /DNA_START=51 /DNA_END=656 /DNA_ORIENTATION=-
MHGSPLRFVVVLLLVSAIVHAAAPKNPYKVLGVEKKASAKEIRKAYHKLAVQHHPDKGGDPEKFKEVAAAYELLADEQARKDYDSGASSRPADAGHSTHPKPASDPFATFRNMHTQFKSEFKGFDFGDFDFDMSPGGGSHTSQSFSFSTSTSSSSGKGSTSTQESSFTNSKGQTCKKIQTCKGTDCSSKVTCSEGVKKKKK